MSHEIWVVPFPGQGHLLPSMELCKLIASRNFKTTLLISTYLSSSIPFSLRQFPLVDVVELPWSSRPPPPPPPQHVQPQPTGSSSDHHFHRRSEPSGQPALETLLSNRSRKPVLAVVDIMMSWSMEIFNKFKVPVIGFFTSGACSAAMEYALWEAKVDVNQLKPGEARLLPGLPEEMAITHSDLKSRPHGPPPGGPPPPGPGFELPGGPPPQPPRPSGIPRWLEETAGCIALMINSCDELEHPFIQYLTTRIKKPVWGVGPLLPEQYWNSNDSVVYDHEIRSVNRQSTVTEEEVMKWLDLKPRGSTVYVSFGSEVGPTMEEYPNLAEALQESNRPFIWVIQPGSGRSPPGPTDSKSEGYFPHGLDKKVGERGLFVQGWAPQLLILSHKSTAGFLSHCGWNSTIEAVGRGVPFLAWPIRGDQHYNAKLIVKHLKIGHMVCEDLSKMIEKEDIVKGIEKLYGDEAKERAMVLRENFKRGFPASSMAALDAFKEFVIACETGQLL